MELVKLKLRTRSKKRKVFTVEKLGIFLSIFKIGTNSLSFLAKKSSGRQKEKYKFMVLIWYLNPGCLGVIHNHSGMGATKLKSTTKTNFEIGECIFRDCQSYLYFFPLMRLYIFLYYYKRQRKYISLVVTQSRKNYNYKII